MTERTSAIQASHVSRDFGLFRSPRQRLLTALGLSALDAVPVFHALTDISFDVPAGAAVGIVGRNGSGKSTLLQIICGILEPTSGEVTVNGRISAILDLGGGFNPELTGRENVSLRAAILDVERSAIESHLGDVERFADIGAFFDRPIKTYSSGMFVRLAFAAAIHSDPDILVIDEALEVGDARFQHKCFHKIRQFRSQGKTILLVTHNTEAVVRHCDQAYLIEAGALIERGRPRDVVNSYLELVFTGKLASSVTRPVPGAAIRSPQHPDAERDDSPSGRRHAEHRVARFLTEVTMVDRSAAHPSYNPHEHRIGDRRGDIVDYLIASRTATDDMFTVNAGSPLDIYIKARFTEHVGRPMFGISLKTRDGIVVYASNSRYQGLMLDAAQPEETVVFCFSLSCLLHPGDYFLDLGLADMTPDTDLPVDIRYGMVHIVVQSEVRFDGIVNLDLGAGEVGRCKPARAQLEPMS